MRRLSAIAAAILLVSGCESPKKENKPAAAASNEGTNAAAPKVELGDLSTTLEPVRAAFNAQKGQARFLTLLSPT